MMAEDTLKPPVDPKLAELKNSVGQLSAEAGYHKQSMARIDEIRGYLHRQTINGEDSTRLSNCLVWIKSVKQNIKSAYEQTQQKLTALVDEIKKGEKENGQDKK